MMERKYFVCEDFGYITCYCRNMENRQKERPTQRSLNKFEVLKNKVMSIGEGSEREIRKDRKTILRGEKLKKGKQWRYKRQKQIRVWKRRINC